MEPPLTQIRRTHKLQLAPRTANRHITLPKGSAGIFPLSLHSLPLILSAAIVFLLLLLLLILLLLILILLILILIIILIIILLLKLALSHISARKSR